MGVHWLEIPFIDRIHIHIARGTLLNVRMIRIRNMYNMRMILLHVHVTVHAMRRDVLVMLLHYWGLLHCFKWLRNHRVLPHLTHVAHFFLMPILF